MSHAAFTCPWDQEEEDLREALRQSLLEGAGSGPEAGADGGWDSDAASGSGWGAASGPVGLHVECGDVWGELTEVGRCRLTVSKPGLKAPMVSTLETIIGKTAFKCSFQCQLAPLHRGGGAAARRGRAVQVDPIKPTLKPPGTMRLTL
jgi:hypothetical protein